MRGISKEACIKSFLKNTTGASSIEEFIGGRTEGKYTIIASHNCPIEFYINSNGRLDSIYENDRYIPSVKIKLARTGYMSYYFFDGEIVTNHPFFVNYIDTNCEDDMSIWIEYFIGPNTEGICNYMITQYPRDSDIKCIVDGICDVSEEYPNGFKYSRHIKRKLLEDHIIVPKFN